MMDAVEALETERDNLRRELIGVQEMLALVLYSLGEPMVLTKEFIQNGLPEGAEIRIDENLQEECFVFSLVADA